MIALAQPNPGRARSRNSIGPSAVPFSMPPHALHALRSSRRRCSAGPATGMRAAFDLRAARHTERQAQFSRAIEIEGGPRLVMSYNARVFISSPQEKARRLLEAAETGRRENIDCLQVLDRACVHVPGTHDQASATVPYAIKSGSRSGTFCERAPCFTEVFLCRSDSSFGLGDLVIEP
jgi:hypothetical protein